MTEKIVSFNRNWQGQAPLDSAPVWPNSAAVWPIGKPGEIVECKNIDEYIGLNLLRPAPDPSKNRALDCSRGDRPGVIISDTTAILLAEAFCDMANERRLYVATREGAENFWRAFEELELMRKVIEK